MMSWIRELYFVAACDSFVIKLQHVPGIINTAADMLSWGRVSKFIQKLPEADANSTIPVKNAAMHEWY